MIDMEYGDLNHSGHAMVYCIFLLLPGMALLLLLRFFCLPTKVKYFLTGASVLATLLILISKTLPALAYLDAVYYEKKIDTYIGSVEEVSVTVVGRRFKLHGVSKVFFYDSYNFFCYSQHWQDILYVGSNIKLYLFKDFVGKDCIVDLTTMSKDK
jgi:hypothetical protein